MSVKRYAQVDINNVALTSHPVHYVCTTTAELPTSGLKLGDTALALDTNIQYKAASSTTWAISGEGGGTPATTVTSGVAYGQSPVVGADTNFSREGHGHGSVAHDSHTLLSGITVDQHHARDHGSAQHPTGAVEVQNEGVALGPATTFNFVGDDVQVSLAGTVATVTTLPSVPSSPFGPLAGAPSVRNGAKPTAVTDPGGGITFTSGADLQAKINANPANSIFVAAANTTYTWQQISPGNKHPRIYFLGNPETTVLDGGGSQTMYGILGDNTAGGEVHGGRFYRMGTGVYVTTGWLVQDVIADTNYEIGLVGNSMSGAFTFKRCITRNNGKYGLTSTISQAGTGWGPAGCLYEDIEIANNNTRHLDPDGDAGGTKFSGGCRDGIWRRIWAHDNWGAGLWWDGYHSGNLIEDCVSENNRSWGVFLELGWGNTTARRMYVKDNASGVGNALGWFSHVQMLVSCVDGTQVANPVASRGTGMAGGTGVIVRDSIIDGDQRAMGVITHDGHPINTKLISFLHNQVYLRRATAPPDPSGQVGGQDSDTNQVLWTENITFDQNEYHAPDLGLLYWKWDTGSGQGAGKTWTQWRAFGKDANSTLDTNMI